MEGAASRPSLLNRLWHLRWVRTGLIIATIVLLLFLCRFHLLRAMGNFLITDTPTAHADVAYVLGGAAWDRGREAARLYNAGIVHRFVCTGSQTPGDLEALGLNISEGGVTRKVMIDGGVPADSVVQLDQGTSTMEEAGALLDVARHAGVDTVLIVSHAFHLRRIRFVFEDRFRKAGVTVLLHGSPSDNFDEQRWWETESGLMIVFNEYVKLLYYHLKY
jgi:uncharacterized SAM-binding protein YcdF (DUF218 family)